MKRLLAAVLVAVLLLLCGCTKLNSAESGWEAGFGSTILELPYGTQEPLYIAGYHGGWEITGVRDLQQARALWLSDGNKSTVLIVVDCVGLGNGTVRAIRERLSEFSRETGCDSIHVIATHTHAGVDTLGLWGPMGIDGKNAEYMEILIAGAVEAAEAAYADRRSGSLLCSAEQVEQMQKDSRDPQVYDSTLYQLRFVSEDPSQNGIRLVSFAAHAEALRGDNTLVSRDYPGVLCDYITQQTGEDVLFVPGAIGGLIMTPELTRDGFNAEENLVLTGQRLGDAALAAQSWQPLEPELTVSRVEWETPLENTIFLYYRFLGILDNEVRQGITGTYYLQSELTLLRVGEWMLALLPGEPFPELVSGTGKDQDPKGLAVIAAEYGVENMMVVGLANDEIGYIVPPSDFVLDSTLPYLQEAEGNHYEETNSVGSGCARDLAEAFEKALAALLKE